MNCGSQSSPVVIPNVLIQPVIILGVPFFIVCKFYFSMLTSHCNFHCNTILMERIAPWNCVMVKYKETTALAIVE